MPFIAAELAFTGRRLGVRELRDGRRRDGGPGRLVGWDDRDLCGKEASE